MKVIMAILTALASTLASAQDWTHKMTKDAFSDEEIWAASVHHQVEGQQFTLFVNCRDDGPMNVGLTGTDIRLLDGEQAHSRTYYRIPVRFDDDEPSEEHFVDQGDVMFLAMAPLFLTYLPEKADSIQKRVVHRFVKILADRSRLRMKLSQPKGTVVLDFPLTGSSDALLAIVQGCSTVAAEGTEAFLDAQGTPYGTLADMLMDATWQSRMEKRVNE